MDHADILTDDEEAALTKQVRMLEDSIGSQIVVLTINSLDGEKIENYSLRRAEEMKIGRKDYDDGILITAAVRDRQMRIEVGIGLENIIKDEIASQILSDQMAPMFREEKYYEGFRLSIERLSALIIENKDLVGSRPH